MITNAIIYRLTASTSLATADLEALLARVAFVPCGLTQQQSSGWVPPRGEKHGALIESIGGQIILKLMTETRPVPAATVKARVDEIAAKIEQDTGRKPGKKQTKELKEQALLELLPMAFTKRASTTVWIDPKGRTVVIDAGSQSRADEVASLLVKTIEGLALGPLHTSTSATVAMSDWLVSGEPPASFTVDRDCELKSADEMKSVVRYARHMLDIEEVRQHITSGKVPTKLGLTWEGRISFLLTDTMQLKKLTFLDVVFEGQKALDHASEAFDADAAIATGELRQLIPALIDALGGEHVLGELTQAA